MAYRTDIFQIEMFEQVCKVSCHALYGGRGLMRDRMPAMRACIPAIYPMLLMERREERKPFFMA